MYKTKQIAWLIIFIIISIIGLLIEFIARLIAPFLAIKTQYGLNVLKGIDVSISTAIGGDTETVSSRLGKARLKGSGWGYVADKVDLVAELFGDYDHCNKAVNKNEGEEQVTRY